MRTRDERGIAFPSPLVMISVVAIALAGFALFATGDEPAIQERIQPSSSAASQESARADEAAKNKSAEKKPDTKKSDKKAERKKKKPPEPAFVRSETYVEVYNNSGITGLAASYAASATEVGWQVVGEDNWYGAIPSSTVYYPERLEAAARQLGLDLGISRVLPAVDPMKMDRLTVVLTDDAA